MWNLLFWRASAERAAKTAAQVAAAGMVVGTTGAADLDWRALGGLVLVAVLASVCTSVASSPFGDAGTPSLVEGVE
jgi:hypothetical protein